MVVGIGIRIKNIILFTKTIGEQGRERLKKTSVVVIAKYGSP
jgi:hypothetical protein